MKIKALELPKSSFLSVDKDLSIICDKIANNKRLQKYLYYTTDNPLIEADLTNKEIGSLYGKQIRIVPKLQIEGDILNYIILSCDNFVPNATNPEFRDNIIEIDIICHFDQWQMKDFELRPYKIAGELDSMLDGKKLTGIGYLEFLGASQIILTDEFAGICLMYQAVHGVEDKEKMPNPQDEAQFIKDFNEMLGQ